MGIVLIVSIALISCMMLLLAPADLCAEWVKDGVPICSSSGDQWYGYIASDGQGGAIIVWEEYRADNSNADLFAQRIDKDGSTLWQQDGVPISLAPGIQFDPQVIADGCGGAVISWRDERSGDFDIYAQRVDANGEVLWTPNGVAVCIGMYGQYGPSAVADGRGSYIIAWRDDRSGYGQIYCQKLDGNGNAQWAANGFPVCSTLWWQDSPTIIPDASGGAIITWEDERYSIMNSFIYAQRIDGNGSKLWEAGGVPIDNASGRKWEISCIEDGHGGGIVSWRDNRAGGENVYAQRFDSTGSVLWTSGPVPVCTATNDQIGPSIAPDGVGGAIIAWLDSRDGRDDIYAQRVGNTGDVKWPLDGVIIRIGPPETGFSGPAPGILSDNGGGAVMAWQEGLGTATSWDILAQRVDADGNLLWPDSSVAICRAPNGQYFPQMTSNGEGGAIITWRDMRNGSKGAVYAMRVTANGETVATMLQSHHAYIGGSSFITIEWRLSEVDPDAQFDVLRREPGHTGYEELSGGEIQGSGLLFTYVDKSCEPGVSYNYRVDVSDGEGRRVLFESEEIALPPLPLTLFQNYPNPFNPSTVIAFNLPSACEVTLKIYDSSGRLIARLLDRETKPAGKHAVEWRGLDERGGTVGSGVYFCRLRAGKETISKKMVLLK
jgi:hypothetical protein